MATYEVVQAHWGDGEDGKRKRFEKGDIREADPATVKTHVKFGHLKPRLPQLDHDGDGSPGGSLPDDQTDASGDAD